jgi:antitoxin (DNA-binding transcriptional repressor) of toxin-antitoxin stability system
MHDISISEFEAKCLALIQQVHKTRQPLRIPRHRRPVAEVVPAGPDHRRRQFVGDMARTGKVISSAIALDESEAYHR